MRSEANIDRCPWCGAWRWMQICHTDPGHAGTPPAPAAAAPPAGEHGTRSRYRAGCRCDDCRTFQGDYMRARRAETIEPTVLDLALLAISQRQRWTA